MVPCPHRIARIDHGKARIRAADLTVPPGASITAPGQRRGPERACRHRSLLGDLREAVWSVNAGMPLAQVRTMDALYRQSMASTSVDPVETMRAE
jgi:hypothetical protein